MSKATPLSTCHKRKRALHARGTLKNPVPLRAFSMSTYSSRTYIYMLVLQALGDSQTMTTRCQEQKKAQYNDSAGFSHRQPSTNFTQV